MSYTTVYFYRIFQDRQDYGGDDQTMTSTVYFAIERDGEPVTAASADLKQTVGDDYETGSIEVGPPKGYDGPWDQAAFAEGAAQFYRGAVGSAGHAIRLSADSVVRMRDNMLYGVDPRRIVEFETDEVQSGAW